MTLPALSRLSRLSILGVLGLPLAAQAAPGGEDILGQLNALLNIPLEVSASKSTTIFESPSTVSVVDRDTIERYGFTSLAEALETLSGVYITQPLWNRNLPTFRGVLQESYANRVLLLINGVAAWNTLTGDLYLSRVDIEDVERIEVLKGPASVLYGTNAYAGAINVILRRGGERTTRAHVGHQDQGGYRIGASHMEKLGAWNLLVSANGQRDVTDHHLLTMADPTTREIEAGPDYLMAEQFHARNANLLLEGMGLTLQFNAYHEESPWFGAANRRTYGGGTNWENNGHFFHLRYQYVPTPSLTLKYSATHDASGKQSPVALTDATFPGTVTSGIGLRQRGSRLAHVLSAAWDINQTWGLEAGVTSERRTNDYYQQFDNRTGQTLGKSTLGLDGESNLKDVSITEESLFVQGNLKVDNWRAILGTRYTRNEQFGSNTSSRFTVVYAFGPLSSLKFMYGQSFRAPAVLESRIRFGSVWGNQDLKPETSDSFELSYLAGFGDVFIQAIVYRSSYKNKAYRSASWGLIPVPEGTTIGARRYYQNAPEFQAKGVELEVKYQNPKILNAFLNVDYISGNRGDEILDMVGTSRVLVGYNYKMVPTWSITGGLSKALAGFTGALLVNHQSGCEGPLGPVDYLGRTWATIPAWTNVDLTLSYAHRLGAVSLRHTAALKNASDQERYSPEATRRNVNRIPFMEGRRGSYTLSLSF